MSIDSEILNLYLEKVTDELKTVSEDDLALLITVKLIVKLKDQKYTLPKIAEFFEKSVPKENRDAISRDHISAITKLSNTADFLKENPSVQALFVQHCQVQQVINPVAPLTNEEKQELSEFRTFSDLFRKLILNNNQ
jgi:hypothetical protein